MRNFLIMSLVIGIVGGIITNLILEAKGESINTSVKSLYNRSTSLIKSDDK